MTLIVIAAFIINLVVPELIPCAELLISQLPGVINSFVDVFSGIVTALFAVIFSIYLLLVKKSWAASSIGL